MFQNQSYNKGVSLIEILVALAILAIVFATLFSLTSFSLRMIVSAKQTIQANYLAQETIEAVKNFRDGTIWDLDGLGKLATSTDYFPLATSSKWQMVQGIEEISGFTRKVVFQDVKRDSNFNIVETGGNYDPNTKKVIVTVSWQEKGRERQIQIMTYLTNWRK